MKYLPRSAALGALIAVSPMAAYAHQLVVFASVDCETVVVEAKFSNGRTARKGDVRVLDGDNTLQQQLTLGENGTAVVNLESVDHSSGLVIEVDTGGHDNYWIVTPEDIARTCGS